jgi:hypothetical protein
MEMILSRRLSYVLAGEITTSARKFNQSANNVAETWKPGDTVDRPSQ